MSNISPSGFIGNTLFFKLTDEIETEWISDSWPGQNAQIYLLNLHHS